MIRIVVEPHADDAFLSMGHHLENWRKDGHITCIITVFSGTRKRAKDAEAYAKAIKAQWFGCGFVEQEEISEVAIKDFVNLYTRHMQGLNSSPFELYIPLALTHPEHILVRNALEEISTGFYVDQPYAMTQKNSGVVTKLLKGKQVLSYCHPGKRKYRHIPLFKDQSKFFYFNNEEKLLQTFEMIVR